ncbi:MAG: SUMF1/EgtB/PvdO family nonheme iron enzyme, partial [Pirellulaceae bacterium]|nr:SUMF1/EgtB/PvdO family nonheme iron enzyme [Pirellulaceae bacterium]
GRLLLVMEHTPGQDLAAVVARQGPLAVSVAVGYIVQAARGLQHAHEHGIVHGNLKPANLLLGDDGRICVLDLGLARLTQAIGQEATVTRIAANDPAIGSVDWISPEQAAGAGDLDARSDIYSLACTAYHLLAGKPPFAEGTDLERLQAHIERPVPRLADIVPDVPEGLPAVIARMMAKSPSDRFSSMAEAITALEPFAGLPSGSEAASTWDEAVPAEPEATLPWVAAPRAEPAGAKRERRKRHRAAEFVLFAARHRRAGWIAAVVAGLLMIGLGTVVFWRTPEHPDGNMASGVIPMNGLAGLTVLTPKVFPAAWHSKTAFASVRGDADAIEYPPVAAASYVLELEFSSVNPSGCLEIQLTPSAEASLISLGSRWTGGLEWIGEADLEAIRCRLIRWMPGSATAHRGIFDLAPAEKHRVKLVAIEERMVLYLDSQPRLETTGEPRDLCLSIRAQGNIDATIHRLSLRKLYEEDAIALDTEMPRYRSEPESGGTRAGDDRAQEELADRPEPARPFVIPSTGMVMNWVAPGEFRMGHPTRQGHWYGQGSQQVRMERGFWLGQCEVTQEAWNSLMPTNPSRVQGSPRLPVHWVTWYEALRFCRVLNDREQRAGRLPEGYEYRLPTEAEWEYVCRTGVTEKADEPVRGPVWHVPWMKGLRPVGQDEPNGWGFHDMLDNVAEWCLDAWRPYPPAGKPSVPQPRFRRGDPRWDRMVVRGTAAWWDDALQRECLPSFRWAWRADTRTICGVRLALAPKLDCFDSLAWEPKDDPLAAGRDVPPAVPPSDADRSVAQWVLSIGGAVTVAGNDGEADEIRDPGQLPASTFRVIGIDLAENRRIAGDDFERLADLRDLQRLSLAGTPFRDSDLVHLRNLHHLSDLNLARTRVSLGGLSPIRELASLRTLNLAATKGGESAQIPSSVTELDLSRTAIADDDVDVLAKLKALNQLTLSHPRVTQSGLQRLKAALPGCRIVQEPASPDSALQLDGQAYVNIPSLRYEGSHPLTIEATITPTAYSGRARIIGNALFGGTVLELLSDKLVWQTLFNDGRRRDIGYASVGSKEKAAIGKTSHVAMVCDLKELRLYVDGKLQGASPLENRHYPSPLSLLIGAQRHPVFAFREYFHGIVDEVRISRTARYTGEFSPTPRFEPDPDTMALYHFDEADGDLVYDASGNGHHGILVGARRVPAASVRAVAATASAKVLQGPWKALLEKGGGATGAAPGGPADSTPAASSANAIHVKQIGSSSSVPFRTVSARNAVLRTTITAKNGQQARIGLRGDSEDLGYFAYAEGNNLFGIGRFVPGEAGT